MADFYLKLGRALCREHRFFEAVKALRKAADASCGDASVLVELGHAEVSAGMRGAARATFDRVLATDPGRAAAHNGVGCTELQAARAEQSFRRAVELDPHQAVYRLNLARALASQHKTWEAEDEFRVAVELDPADPVIVQAYGEFLLADRRIRDARRVFLDAAASIDSLHHAALESREANDAFATHTGESYAARLDSACRTLRTRAERMRRSGDSEQPRIAHFQSEISDVLLAMDLYLSTVKAMPPEDQRRADTEVDPYDDGGMEDLASGFGLETDTLNERWDDDWSDTTKVPTLF